MKNAAPGSVHRVIASKHERGHFFHFVGPVQTHFVFARFWWGRKNERFQQC